MQGSKGTNGGARRILVLGFDEFHRNILRSLEHNGRWHRAGSSSIECDELLGLDELVEVERGFSFAGLLAAAEEQLRNAGKVDGIVNHWDFPGSCLHPVLCKRNGFPGPSPIAVARCEHKYWARQQMRDSVPELTPEFCIVDPMKPDPAAELVLDYPFWLKPIVAHSSFLGFRVEDKRSFQRAIEVMRRDIAWFGKPFEEFLGMIDLPDDFPGGGGCLAVAEQIISADDQFTLEGYVCDGRVEIYGVIDSIREGGRSSFSRYEYPSRLPAAVIDRAREASMQLVPSLTLDHCCFNIEFFWDESSERLSLLEINTRISKSHSPLFLIADGESHHRIAMELALGLEPSPWQRGGGQTDLAAKFMVRLFQDGVVKHLPGDADLDRFAALFPEALVSILVREGDRLSTLKFQDSYSFELADLFIGGASDRELARKFRQAMEILPFEVDLIAPSPAPSRRELRQPGQRQQAIETR